MWRNIFIFFILTSSLSAQISVESFIANMNNITEGQTFTNQNIFTYRFIRIANQGSDGISNYSISIFDDQMNFIETVIFPTNAEGEVYPNWHITYNGLTGLGNSCIDGGKDHIVVEDDAFTTIFENPNQCVKLAPMPITYQNQPSAKLQNNLTHISWSIATQVNNEKYIIEHSNDGRNFSSIGEITGDGSSNVTKHYEYIHTSPSFGNNYYRIKQVDYDGKYSYSDIASLRYDDHGETNIYPNPATSEVTISTTEPTSLQIFDVYGRVLSKQDISEGQNTINVSIIPTGILIFVIGDHRYKVLKE
jgi:hypothetical protein